MAKLTIDDLKKIKEKTAAETALRHGTATVKVTVHMGTCGIAAGARDVMGALMDEINRSDRHDIRAAAAACPGMCQSEPNVTVEVEGREPIVYGQMDADKMRQVFRRHVLEGEVQSDFTVART